MVNKVLLLGMLFRRCSFSKRATMKCRAFQYLLKVKHAVWHRFHPQHRYHILQTGLHPGYHDPNKQITCALFKSVCDFLDATDDFIDWSNRKEVYRKLDSARRFWKQTGKFFLEGSEDPSWHEETRHHLHNIVDVIDFLWYP
jgi:hypothetical protein